ENRAGAEVEAPLLLEEDIGSDHVGRQQVIGALDPRGLGVQRTGQSAREGGLADPRDVLDQAVALAKQRDEQSLDHLAATPHRPLDVLPQRRPKLRNHPWIDPRSTRHLTAMVWAPDRSVAGLSPSGSRVSPPARSVRGPRTAGAA